MAMIETGRELPLGRAFLLSLIGMVLLAGAAAAQDDNQSAHGWKLEPDVDPPSYAVIEPSSSTLNVEALVLTCEQAGDRRVLQFQLYVSEPGPLMPTGGDSRALRSDPRAEVLVDGRIHPVSLFFAEDYVVLADAVANRAPYASDRLLNAVERGKTMVIRFDLLAKRGGERHPFDGEVTFDLQPGAGGTTIAAVRHCTDPNPRPNAGVARPPQKHPLRPA